jgi:hypothetical protein
MASLPSPAPSPASSPSPDGPDWAREAVALALDEARRFLATAFGFMRRPGRFCADWLAGRQHALNPLGFVATALGISGLIGALLRNPDGDGIWLHLMQLARLSPDSRARRS